MWRPATVWDKCALPVNKLFQNLVFFSWKSGKYLQYPPWDEKKEKIIGTALLVVLQEGGVLELPFVCLSFRPCNFNNLNNCRIGNGCLTPPSSHPLSHRQCTSPKPFSRRRTHGAIITQRHFFSFFTYVRRYVWQNCPPFYIIDTNSLKLSDMYCQEVDFKKTVVENVAHSPDRNLLMFYTASWLHQPYIDSDSKLLLGGMLCETGHR